MVGGGGGVGAAMFDDEAAAKFAMGEDTLMTSQDVNPGWPTPSPASYRLRADAWLCCRALEGRYGQGSPVLVVTTVAARIPAAAP